MIVTNLSPPFFDTEKEEKQYSFWIGIRNHRDSALELNVPNKDFDFGVIAIPNKRGDNLVLVKGCDIKGLASISFEALAKMILWKNRIDIIGPNEDQSTWFI